MRLFNNLSITIKLILVFLLIGFGSIVIVGFYSYRSAKSALIARTFDQLTSVRTVKKDRIEGFFNDRKLDIILFANSEEINNIINNEKVSTDGYLFRYIQNCGYYQNFIVYTPQQSFEVNITDNTASIPKIINNIDFNFDIEKLYLKLKTRNDFLIKDYFTFLFSDKQSKLSGNTGAMEHYLLTKENIDTSLYINYPIRKGSNVIGMVMLQISLDAINKIMLENSDKNGLGKTGESYLVGSDLLMRSVSRFEKHPVLKTKVNTVATQNVFGGNEGNEIIRDYRNIEVLSSYGKINIKDIGWAIVAEIDIREAMIPIVSIRNDIIYLSILLSLFIAAIAYILSKTISKPIIELKDASIEVGEGNYNTQVSISNKDEIGMLADAFNKMINHINEERTKRISAMIDGQEMERMRIAREIHDGLGQLLIAIKLKLENLKQITNIKENEAEELTTMFNTTIDEARRISDNLMPSILKELGLAVALHNLCRDIETASGIKVDFEMDATIKILDNRIKTYLYRIAQEAMNNIVKHSKANNAKLSVYMVNNRIIMLIEDNGIGFDVSKDTVNIKGNGLSNMQERVTLLGGNFTIETAINNGTNISINIPIK